MGDRAKLSQRPAELDYRKQIEERMLKHRSTHMLEMNGLGFQTAARKPYEVVDRVALINISGVLTNDAWWWDETEYGEIRADLKFASEDADVDGVLLVINSPGGETDNAFETADYIAEVARIKPVWASAEPYAYSAAYMLASQAKVIYVPPISGGVGSIGVYTLHFDYSEMLKEAGIKVTQVSAGKGKLDRSPYAPLSEDARERMQTEINRLYGEFVSRVTAGRKLEKSAIVKLGALLYDGFENASQAGLADRAGSYETALGALGERVAKLRTSGLALTSDDPETTKDGLRYIGGVLVGFDDDFQGGTMPDQPKATAPANPAAPAPAAPPPAAASAPTNQPDVTVQLQADAQKAGYSAATEVVELCALAGKPEMAADFLRKETPVAEVRKQLLNARADASDAPGETAAGVMPFAGKSVGGSKEMTAKPAKSSKELMQARFAQKGAN